MCLMSNSCLWTEGVNLILDICIGKIRILARSRVNRLGFGNSHAKKALAVKVGNILDNTNYYCSMFISQISGITKLVVERKIMKVLTRN